MCKHGDVFSLAVLIGRGLDLFEFQSELFSLKHFIFSVFPLRFFPPTSPFVQFLGCDLYAPLAQLVEHLTLNQGVQGSSP